LHKIQKRTACPPHVLPARVVQKVASFLNPVCRLTLQADSLIGIRWPNGESQSLFQDLKDWLHLQSVPTLALSGLHRNQLVDLKAEIFQQQHDHSASRIAREPRQHKVCADGPFFTTLFGI